MSDTAKHVLSHTDTIATALEMLNALGDQLTLFVLDDEHRLVGTLTDGDIRRGLLKHLQIEDPVKNFMNTKFRYIQKNNYKLKELDEMKKIGIGIIPMVDHDKRIIRLINFDTQRSVLPVDAVIMAGGEGLRLRPMTEKLPKPLLKVGPKPIMEHGIDHLITFGVDQVTISINYLGEKIIEHFGNGTDRNISIHYVHEKEKLGTIGSLSLIEHYHHDHVLVMNSDLLTNIDFEEFFREYENKNADMSVACIPYVVNIPYAILDTDHERVLSLKEKPNLTYHSNAGIYLVRKEHIARIPKDKMFNATDLIEELIAANKKVTFYPILGYWLDIGKMDDFQKAQEDIKHIKF